MRFYNMIPQSATTVYIVNERINLRREIANRLKSATKQVMLINLY